MGNVSYESSGENQNTVLYSTRFFSKILPFMRQRGNILKNRTGHSRNYGACPLHAGYLWLQTQTLRICNIFFFFAFLLQERLHDRA